MKRFRDVAAAAVVLIPVALALWAVWLEPRRLVTRVVSLRIDDWTLDSPLRIAVISDLHVGSPFNGVGKLERVVRATNAATPDIVVLLGDYVIQGVIGGRFVPPEQIASVLSRLEAPLGTYAVLGNHDWWLDAPRVRQAFTANRLTVLDDTATHLKFSNGGFWLAGISDFMEGRHDVSVSVAPVTNSEPVIAITHNPDIFPQVPPRVALTIAGHTHGGQVAIPLIGRPIVPSRYGERYAVGHVVENGRDLFVTAGVGTSILPVRFGVPPEVVLLTISRR